MFRASDSQRSLFSAGGLMTPEKRVQCERSWAGPFREKALPILLRHENDFADLFDPDNGRPNRPVVLVVGTLILKEMFDLTDQVALQSLDFDVRWWYAFELESPELHLCQKTLHNFRHGMMEHGKDQLLFCKVTDELVGVLGIDVKRQRMDSKHVVSNIAILTRLGVFCETMRIFLRALKIQGRNLSEQVGGGILKRYGEDATYADARKGEAPRRLSVAARDVYRLVNQFRQDEGVAALEEFKLLHRLFEEQVQGVPEAQPPKDDDDDHGEGAVPVVLKPAKEVGSDSMQTPHDPDATYSGHKGKGYEMQVTETCVPQNPVQLITRVEVTQSCKSDFAATIPALEDLKKRDLLPEELVTDTNFGGGKNAAAASEMGVNLLCPAPAPSKPQEGVLYETPSPQCPKQEQAATQWLREREAQPEFQRRYAIRAGVEATNSELNRAHGAKNLRVRGESRVRLALRLKATACNVKRAVRYWLGWMRQGIGTAGGEPAVRVAAAL